MLSNLELILRQMIPDIHTFIENTTRNLNIEDKMINPMISRTLIGQSRLNENKISLRKEENRKLFMFDELDLKALFIERLRNIFAVYEINIENLSAFITDPTCLENLLNIIKS